MPEAHTKIKIGPTREYQLMISASAEISGTEGLKKMRMERGSWPERASTLEVWPCESLLYQRGLAKQSLSNICKLLQGLRKERCSANREKPENQKNRVGTI